MSAVSLIDRAIACGVDVHRILHIGASEGQEIPYYLKRKFAEVTFIEAIEAVASKLATKIERLGAGRPRMKVVRALCSDVGEQEVDFFVASNGGQSSSMLAPSSHLVVYESVRFAEPAKMITTTLDRLSAEGALTAPDLIIMDVQGAEELVLRGGPELLRATNAIVAEVSNFPLYAGSCTTQTLTDFLNSAGFNLHSTAMTRGIGDALFIRSGHPLLAEKIPAGSNVASIAVASQSSLSRYSSGPDDAAGVLHNPRLSRFNFHTELEANPWWMADLRKPCRIEEVRVYNRRDVAQERAFGLRIFLSQDARNWEMIHDQAGVPFGAPPFVPLRVFCEGAAARFVRLELPGQAIFHLNQVQIFGAE